MTRIEILEAIVLTTMDIGEADRFCILLTKERGRIAARARGVRRPGSRMGGGLLPFTLLRVSLRETNAGYCITGAEWQSTYERPWAIASFLKAAQGVEWLLLLLEDEEPLPEIFVLARAFLQECSRCNTKDPVLPFTVRLLQLLGVLPREFRDTTLSLSGRERAFLAACGAGDADLPMLSQSERTHIASLALRIVEDQAGRMPRVPAVRRQMLLR